MATDGVPSTQSDSFGESRRSIKAQLETGWGRSVTEYGELRGGFREPPAANR
jgi:hypothetical protein